MAKTRVLTPGTRIILGSRRGQTPTETKKILKKRLQATSSRGSK